MTSQNKYIIQFFKLIRLLVLPVLLSGLLSSCFTGVEGTKKISLSREDKKTIAPTKEEAFFKNIHPAPLADWTPGRKFIAADNRTILIFDQEGLPANPDDASIGGKALYYKGTEERLTPAGNKNLVIVFSDGNNLYRYNTGKEASSAVTSIQSDAIPMMIDCEMIDEVNSLLKGKTLWTRSPLWYDTLGNRFIGKKYVPVTILNVEPGSMVFPIKVLFEDSDKRRAWTYLNFGTSGKDSRSFSNMFSLSDIRKKYPHIDDDVWQLICNGKVRVGMTKNECKLALGNPQDVNSGHDYSQTLDLWHYTDGVVLWFEDGLLSKYRI